MAASILQPEHIAAIRRAAAGAAGGASMMPILSSVCLQSSRESFRVTGTNIEIQVQASAPPLDKEFECCVEAARMIKALSFGGAVGIQPADGKIIVTAGRSRFTIPTLPVENFPFMPAVTGDALPVPHGFSAALKELIEFAGDKDLRPWINGVYLEHGHMVATDGHRAAVREIAIPEGVDLIVPRQTVPAISQVSYTTMRVSDNTIHLAGDNIQVTSKLIDAKFPDWRRIVPDPGFKRRAIKFAADEAAEATKQARIMATKIMQGAAIEVSDNTARITVKTDDGSESVSEFLAEGGSWRSAFNVHYLHDAVAAYAGKTVTAHVSDEPIMSILLTSDEAPELRQVVMPMRI